jgi:hypothetical protein
MFNRITSVIQLFVFLWSATLSAQDQMTTLTTTGSGSSKEIAVQQSLRSAIEQAFGAFISAKTEILNDELISDEITSISSGNIQEYELLSEVYNPEASSYFVTTKVTVSVSKLTDFVQSKGVEVEIKGALFAANIIQQELNAKSELKAIQNMLVPFHEAMWKAYDFSMATSQPVLLDNESNEWKIDGVIEANANENLDLAYSLIENTLRGISLSPSEVEEYIAIGKEVYLVFLISKNEPKQASEYEIKGHTLGGPANWAKGTMISHIAETYQVSMSQVLSKLPLDYIKVKRWDYILTKQTPSSIFSWGEVPVPKDFIFLRNLQSVKLLENFFYSMNKVYAQNFDVSSNIHQYSSFFDLVFNSELARLGLIREKKGLEGIYSFTKETPFWEATTYPSTNAKGLKTSEIKVIPKFENICTQISYNFNPSQKKGDGCWLAVKNAIQYNETNKWLVNTMSGPWGVTSVTTIRFLPKRDLLLTDVLTFNDLSRLNGYKIQLSVDEFSFQNGCIILNAQTKKYFIHLTSDLDTRK